MKKNDHKKIIFSGGGTAGSVTPLLAIFDELKSETDFDFLWVGTKTGPEKEMVEKEGIRFQAIQSGKLRRYFSWRNLVDVFKIKIAFWQAVYLVIKERPSLVMSAGSFVSVPIAWAAWLFRVPVLIHQQDVQAGLANKLMAPFASVVTVTFEKSKKDYGDKATWVGNPVRGVINEHRMTRREAVQKLGFREDWPVVLIMGGGTGSLAINKLVEANVEKLAKFTQIIHISGGKKKIEAPEIPGVRFFKFLDTTGMLKAFTAADLVVSRCGLGTLTELSLLGKPAILVPMPNSHQEENARVFETQEAAVVLEQKTLNDKKFVVEIKDLLLDKELQEKLKKNIKEVIKAGGIKDLVKIIKKIIL